MSETSGSSQMDKEGLSEQLLDLQEDSIAEALICQNQFVLSFYFFEFLLASWSFRSWQVFIIPHQSHCYQHLLVSNLILFIHILLRLFSRILGHFYIFYTAPLALTSKLVSEFTFRGPSLVQNSGAEIVQRRKQLNQRS